MVNVVFISYLSNYGGIETYMIRMAHWLTKNGNGVFVLGDSDRENNHYLIEELKKNGGKIEMISFRKKGNRLNLIKRKVLSNHVVCITFSYPGIILADAIFADVNNADLIFYDPHQYGLMMDYWRSNKILKPILRFISKKVCTRLHDNHQIIYMDLLCKKRTISELSIKNQYDDDIILLPMEILEFDREKIRAKFSNGQFNILTICRMTFPFKGYVFGLIDQFECLVRDNKDLTLTIIGAGSDQDKLQKKIDELNDDVKRRIEWIPGLPYEKLRLYFNKANLYVGMGTTVADAVNYGVPALPVGSYTYECKGYNYFYKNPENLGGLYGKNNIYELIQDVINLDVDAYIKHCEKDHNALASIYDINVIGEKFLSFSNSGNNVFNKFERKIISIGKRLIK